MKRFKIRMRLPWQTAEVKRPRTLFGTPQTDDLHYHAPTPDGYFARWWLHLLLFIIALVTTTLAGAEWVTGKAWFVDAPYGLTWDDLPKGLPYSIAFLSFLTFHEFGHFFTAYYYGVRCSLPYYIPIFFPFLQMNIGSMGAVIRLRDIPDTTIKYFDIGIAGPLAGFVVSIILLTYGFTHLPPLEETLFAIHPEYLQVFGRVPTDAEIIARFADPEMGIPRVGNSLIFYLLETTLADPSRMPSHIELMHYPFLFVGFITLFFTALNLLPIGQFDGGHVVYGMFGARVAGLVSRLTVVALVVFGGVGLLHFTAQFHDWALTLGFYLLYLVMVLSRLSPKRNVGFTLALVGLVLGLQQVTQQLLPSVQPNMLWLFFAFVSVRFMRIDHPPAQVEVPIGKTRFALGVMALLIFVLCFAPAPIEFVTAATAPPAAPTPPSGVLSSVFSILP